MLFIFQSGGSQIRSQIPFELALGRCDAQLKNYSYRQKKSVVTLILYFNDLSGAFQLTRAAEFTSELYSCNCCISWESKILTCSFLAGAAALEDPNKPLDFQLYLLTQLGFNPDRNNTKSL